jgi:hypothetical protein
LIVGWISFYKPNHLRTPAIVKDKPRLLPGMLALWSALFSAAYGKIMGKSGHIDANIKYHIMSHGNVEDG